MGRGHQLPGPMAFRNGIVGAHLTSPPKPYCGAVSPRATEGFAGVPHRSAFRRQPSDFLDKGVKHNLWLRPCTYKQPVDMYIKHVFPGAL